MIAPASHKRPPHPSPLERVGSSFAALALLHGKLLKADLRRSARALRHAAAYGGVAIAVLLASAVLTMTALAYLLRDALEFSRTGAFAVTAVVGLAVGAGVGWAALRSLKRGMRVASNSFSELEENLTSLVSLDRSNDPPV